LATTEHSSEAPPPVLCVAENSRLGFKPAEPPVFREPVWPNGETTLGIQPPLRRAHSRPPCSTYGSGYCGGGVYSVLAADNQVPIELPGFPGFKITVIESLLYLPPNVHDNSTPRPNPPSWGNFVHRFLPCFGAQLINNFVGDDDKTTVTLTTNIAAIATGSPIAIGAAALWDAQAELRAGIACATISRRMLN
jgi:hypothetical protein